MTGAVPVPTDLTLRRTVRTTDTAAGRSGSVTAVEPATVTGGSVERLTRAFPAESAAAPVGSAGFAGAGSAAFAVAGSVGFDAAGIPGILGERGGSLFRAPSVGGCDTRAVGG